MARQLLLVRHAPIGPEYAGRYVGSSDVPIAPGSEARLLLLGRWLADRKPSRMVVSPMLRARQTAEALRAFVDVPMSIDPDLREIDFGQWEGKSFEEIAPRWPAEVKKWAEFSADFRFPLGEALGEFVERVKQVSRRLVETPDDVVVAVAHGGVVRMMICQMLGIEERNYLMFDVKCATGAVMEVFEGRGVLSGLNLPR